MRQQVRPWIFKPPHSARRVPGDICTHCCQKASTCYKPSSSSFHLSGKNLVPVRRAARGKNCKGTHLAGGERKRSISALHVQCHCSGTFLGPNYTLCWRSLIISLNMLFFLPQAAEIRKNLDFGVNSSLNALFQTENTLFHTQPQLLPLEK